MTISPVAVTAQDNDVPTVTLVVTPNPIDIISEDGDNVATVTASQDILSGGATTITVTLANDDITTPGAYYTATPMSLVIPAGQTSSDVAASSGRSFTITAADNDQDHPDRTVTIRQNTLVNPSRTSVNDAVADVTLTITDDEARPTVMLNIQPNPIDETDHPGTTATENVAVITATLDVKSNVETTIIVAVAPGEGTVETDYTVTANKTLTIPAGQTDSTGVVTITAVDNQVDAPNKSLTVSAGSVTNANNGVGDPGTGVSGPESRTLTIRDDEGAPTVTLDFSTTTIAENGGTATVTATLNRTTTQQVEVQVSFQPGAASPATLDTDYTLSSTPPVTLTIPAGQTSSDVTGSTGRSITITARDNEVDAPDKTFTVSGSAQDPLNAGEALEIAFGASDGTTVTTNSDGSLAILTIQDDDTAGVTVSKNDLSLDEGDSNTYTLVLDTQPSGNVVIGLTVTGDSDVTVDADGVTPGDQAVLTFTPDKWDQEQTVTVSASQDDDSADDQATIRHAIDRNATQDDIYDSVTGVASVDVTVTDDDVAVTITAVDGSITEGENARFIVRASPGVAESIVVAVNVSGGAAFGVADGDHAVTIAAGSDSRELFLPTVGDDTDEPDGTITVRILSGAGYGVGEPGSASVTVSDDDNPGGGDEGGGGGGGGVPPIVQPIIPIIAIEADTSPVSEGNDARYTITATPAPPRAIDVVVNVSGGEGFTAISGNQIVRLDAGERTARLTIATIDDFVDEEEDDITATLLPRSGYRISSSDGSATVTVTDDDTAGVTVSKASLSLTEGHSQDASDTYTLVLDTQPAGNVVIGLTRTGDANVTVDQTTLTFTPNNWDQEQTVTVNAQEDDDTADDSAVITHAATSSDLHYEGIPVLRWP